jgi:hypothetical protein
MMYLKKVYLFDNLEQLDTNEHKFPQLPGWSNSEEAFIAILNIHMAQKFKGRVYFATEFISP